MAADTDLATKVTDMQLLVAQWSPAFSVTPADILIVTGCARIFENSVVDRVIICPTLAIVGMVEWIKRLGKIGRREAGDDSLVQFFYTSTGTKVSDTRCLHSWYKNESFWVSHLKPLDTSVRSEDPKLSSVKMEL